MCTKWSILRNYYHCMTRQIFKLNLIFKKGLDIAHMTVHKQVIYSHIKLDYWHEIHNIDTCIKMGCLSNVFLPKRFYNFFHEMNTKIQKWILYSKIFWVIGGVCGCVFLKWTSIYPNDPPWYPMKCLLFSRTQIISPN